MHGYGAKHGAPLTDHFYMYIGPSGVSMFFMITGYLFWKRLLLKGESIDWLELYVNRAFRIYPLYLVLIVAYFCIAWSRVVPNSPLSITQLCGELAQWFSFGLFGKPQPLFGLEGATAAVGPTWSLRYEWLFYISLPLLAVFARNKQAAAITASALFLLQTLNGFIAEPYRSFLAQFLCGMLTASILRAFPAMRGDGFLKSSFAVVSLVGAIVLTDTPYSPSGTLFLGASFFLIASGASLFGLLKSRGVKRLGNISYSVYLLHSAVLTILMTRIGILTFALSSDGHFWLTAGLMFSCTVLISVVTFAVIERGGIAIGRRFTGRRLSRREGDDAGAQQLEVMPLTEARLAKPANTQSNLLY